MGQHGEISLMPWRYAPVEDTVERVCARFWVRAPRTPFYLEKTLTVERGKAVLTIEESLTNEGGEPIDLMWGHHIAFNTPVIADGARIDTSAQTLLVHGEMPGFEPRRLALEQEVPWPNAQGASGGSVDASIIPPQGKAGYCEMAYLTDWRDNAWYALTKANDEVGFAVAWDGDHFRYLWYWSELGAQTGYPWWKRFYTVALEPWTSYPTNGLLDAIERGTQLTLEPHQTVSTSLRAIAYEGLEAVSSVSPEGDVFG
jgi:hypothetical protein